MIYFDNAATTRPYPEVLATYTEIASKIWGNPSSLHRLGNQAHRFLEASRKQIADLLGKDPQEIVFTSGGTEADNWIIKGVAFEKQDFGRHILISAVEHPAVAESAQWLVGQGFEVEQIPVDKTGQVDLERFAAQIRPDTILVSVMAVNNEIGRIQPIPEMARILEAWPKVSLHVDAVQALGKLDVSLFLPERVDFASFSAHKFHGLRGVGFAYLKKGKRLSPLLTGGGQEGERRSTTENLAGIGAMAKALRLSMEEREFVQERLAAIKSNLLQELAKYEDVELFSDMDGHSANILTFGIKGVRGEVLLHALEAYDIFVSTTSACSAKAGKPAGTLIAMGVPGNRASSAVRLSFSRENTMAQVEQFLTTFKLIYQQTRKVR
ncbi:cysteine desulfurase [Streptococcus danieliae]|nr:cysteine desulfurase [Streptococcus danieliae]